MNDSETRWIRQDFAGLAEAVETAARTDKRVAEALSDYLEACAGMTDGQASPENRALWREIRTELVNEIERLVSQ